MPRTLSRFIVPVLATLTASACDKPVAIGESNVLLVAAPESVWTALREDINRALEPQVFTVRNERVFDVTPVDPRSDDWPDFRNLRRVLVIGEHEDPWVARALDAAGGAPSDAPALAQARNVWAQNQLVTVLLLPPGSPPEAARPLIEEAGELLVRQYTEYSRRRMFASGADSARADSIGREHGFSLLTPTVYRVRQARPGLIVYRNDNPDPSQLIRQVEVAWRPSGSGALSPESVREWRNEVASEVTHPPQVTEPEIAEVRQLTGEGGRAIEIQGVWSNPPGEWPAAGPYLARAVECGDRTYLASAWLYAPGRPKYQYMIQLATLLESFRCRP